METAKVKAFPIRLAIAGALALAFGLVYRRFLGELEDPYMYMFFGLMGVLVYVMSKFFGKEIYVLALIPRLLIAVNLTFPLFNIHHGSADLQNPLKIHPFTLVLLVIILLEFIEMLYREEVYVDKVVVLGLVMVAVFSAITLVQRGGKGTSLLLENYVVPVALFLLFYMKRDIDVMRMRRCMNILLAFLLLWAVLGVAESLTHENPFNSYFFANSYYMRRPDEKYRVMSTLGHVMFPIMMLVGCFLVRYSVRRLPLRIGLYLFFSVCSMLSQTRVVILLCVAYALSAELIPFIIKKRGNLKLIAIVTGVTLALLGVAGLAVLQTPAGQQLMARFSGDSGSANARIIHIQYLFDNLFTMPLMGIGAFADNVVLTDERGNEVLPEIPWINLYFEVGVFLVLLLLFLLVLVLIGKMKLELLFMLAAFTPYSTLTGKTCCFFMFYLFAAYSVWLQRAEKPPPGMVLKPAKLYPVLGTGKKWLPATALVAVVLAVGAAGYAIGLGRINQVPKLYTASADLYAYSLPQTPADVKYARDNRVFFVQSHQYMAQDAALMAQADEVDARMRRLFEQETGSVLAQPNYAANLRVENMYISRIVRVNYTYHDPQRAALLANLYARALMEYTTEMSGIQYLDLIAPAAVPTQSSSPRTMALPMVQAVCMAMACLLFYLLATALVHGRNMARARAAAPLRAQGTPSP